MRSASSTKPGCEPRRWSPADHPARSLVLTERPDGDGLDEVTTTGPSYIYRLKDGEITLAEFTPEDFGVPRSRPEDLRGGAASDNAAILRQVLEGEPGPHRDVTLVNAAPALVAAGISAGFEEAMVKARASIDQGAALAVLEAVIRRGADLMS